jgi:hypothetical protein
LKCGRATGEASGVAPLSGRSVTQIERDESQSLTTRGAGTISCTQGIRVKSRGLPGDNHIVQPRRILAPPGFRDATLASRRRLSTSSLLELRRPDSKPRIWEQV